jgi:hypothetical protein
MMGWMGRGSVKQNVGIKDDDELMLLLIWQGEQNFHDALSF